MSDPEVELLENIAENIREIKDWIRLTNLSEIRTTMEQEVEEDWERNLYEALDGRKSTRELAQKMPVARITVLNRLKRWRDQGLVRQEKQGKYRKTISLKSLGIEIPELDENDEE